VVEAEDDLIRLLVVNEVKRHQHVSAQQVALEYNNGSHGLIDEVDNHAVDFANVVAIARAHSGANDDIHSGHPSLGERW
jgi:hypothetical protein